MKYIFSILVVIFFLISCQLTTNSAKYQDGKYETTFNGCKVIVRQIEKEINGEDQSLNGIWNFINVQIDCNGKNYYKSENIFKDEIRDVLAQKNSSIIKIFISIGGAGSGNYGECLIYLFDDGQFKLIEMPELEGELNSLYSGHDKFTFNNNTIYRKFPIFKSTDDENFPTGGNVSIEYFFDGNNFILLKSRIDKK